VPTFSVGGDRPRRRAAAADPFAKYDSYEPTFKANEPPASNAVRGSMGSVASGSVGRKENFREVQMEDINRVSTDKKMVDLLSYQVPQVNPRPSRMRISNDKPKI